MNPSKSGSDNYHERRKAERMKDPEFRAAYEQADWELKQEGRKCPDCGGPTEIRAGRMLLMGKASLQNLDKLAEIVPTAIVPTAEGTFLVCSMGCEWYEEKDTGRRFGRR